MKRAYAIAFSGPSNSGKTTLIQKLIAHFKRTKRIAVIKHDPKDKARFDKEGKDSHTFYSSGANVAVLSPTRSTYFFHDPHAIDEVIKRLYPFDLLFIEGLKTLPFPRLVLFREAVNEEYLPYADALAVHKSIDTKKYDIPKELSVFDPDDIDAIAKWIITHAKEITIDE